MIALPLKAPHSLYIKWSLVHWPPLLHICTELRAPGADAARASGPSKLAWNVIAVAHDTTQGEAAALEEILRRLCAPEACGAARAHLSPQVVSHIIRCDASSGHQVISHIIRCDTSSGHQPHHR